MTDGPDLSTSVDELTMSVRTAMLLEERGCTTLADVMALDLSTLPSRRAHELVVALDELGIHWDVPVEALASPVPPPERAAPRLDITFEDDGDPRALTNRLGGLPCAPTTDAAWPSSSGRPMQLVVQLVGKAAGGALDLGDVGVVHVFADMAEEYYLENTVVVHRGPCPAVLTPPAGIEPLPTRNMLLTPGVDDRILVLAEHEEDEEAFAAHGADADAYETAATHAWRDKIFGLPRGANLEHDVRDTKGEPMRLLLELFTYDDFFLWALFANADLTETRLQIVRG